MGKYDSLKLENQMCFPLYACSREILKNYTPHLRSIGLTYTQYIVMLVMWENRDSTVGELSRRLLLDSGTLTPVLKKLEAAGIVSRERSREDERVVRVRVTESGMALREKALSVPAAMASCPALTKEETEQLYKILYKILGGNTGA